MDGSQHSHAAIANPRRLVMTRPGILTAAQRDHLSTTADMLALLPVPGATELARTLACLSTARGIDPTTATHAHALSKQVHRALLFDTAPDRWLELVASFPETEQQEIVGDLIAHRQAQALTVAQTMTLLTPSISRVRSET